MTMGTINYHIPVLLHDSVDGLITHANGVYVDVTYGGGGHSREILSRLNADGKLVSFDQDLDAQQNLIDDDRFVFVPQNFAFLKNNLRMQRLFPVDGVLADLGVSSHQFDTAERGFSFRFDAPLDMRMCVNANKTAVDVLNGYEEAQLYEIFKLYGELDNSKGLANRVVYRRNQAPIKTIEDLKNVFTGMVPKLKSSQFFAKIFQALRIEVNDEMEVLKALLNQLADTVKPEGRIVFITYHSLEDRLVKNFIKTGNIQGDLQKDFYGNVIRPFKEVNRKPVVPSDEELEINPRSRSAKLRIAERLTDK
jgi:16S rRNA (cytosine1402-N4)-methyltransferase